MIHAFDTETHLISPGNPAPKGVCLSYASENGDTGVMLMADGLKWLRQKLEAGDHLVAHNAPFDLSVAVADDPSLLKPVFEAYAEGRIHDTKIRQQILDNARGALKYEYDADLKETKVQHYSLAHLVHRHLDEWIFNDKEGDVWRLRYYTLDGVPVNEWPAEAKRYAIDDSVHALKVFKAQDNDQNADLLDKEHTQTQADWALRLMSCWGSRTTAEDIEVLRLDFEEAFEEQAEICIGLGLAQRTAGKVTKKMAPIRDLVEAHYKNNKLEVPKTEGGKGEVKNPQTSTSKETLTMQAHTRYEPHRGMLAVSEMVRIGKLLSTYIPMLQLGIDRPINPSYNCIIETFRTSCRVPNIQNLPRGGGVRDCWLARPGYVYGFCDYDTLEMRTLAQVYIWMFGKKKCKLLPPILENRDLHLDLAADMLGSTYEKTLEKLKAGDKVVKETRQGTKIGNYGLSGGMGSEAFVAYARGFGVEISLNRAEELKEAFINKWDMSPYFATCSGVAEQRDVKLLTNVVKFYGSGFLRGDVRYTAVCNGYFQHLAAMGAKLALFEVAYACYAKPESPLYGCRPWLFAHDEIGMEIPYDDSDIGRVRASHAMTELRRIMITSMEFYCPDVPIGATGAMSFRWLKGAEPVFITQNGEEIMVPCRKEGEDWVEDYAA